MNPNPPPDRRAPGPHVAPDRPVAFVPRELDDVYAARRAALVQAMEAMATRVAERQRAVVTLKPARIAGWVRE